MTRVARVRQLFVVAVLIGAAVGTGCSRAADDAPPVATPSFAAGSARVALGAPVDVTYRFVMAGDAATLPTGVRVMVHFLDADEEMLFTDDHDPPTPADQWKPGQTIEYTRTVFMPILPYVGPVVVQMGLYSPATGQRFPLAGETTGQRAYKVGTLELVPRPEGAFVIFRDGWNNAEFAPDNPVIEWQWTKGMATLSFRNPRRDATFYLHLDGRPDLAGGRQNVSVRIGDAVVDTVTLEDQKEVLRKVPIQAAQFGQGESVEMTIEVAPTFVPAQVPTANSTDKRELGVRVFHAFVETKP